LTDSYEKILPNFLIIMAAQHSADVISTYGHPAVKATSPDKIVAEGIMLTNAYVAYSMCTPARASFMTGLILLSIGSGNLGIH